MQEEALLDWQRIHAWASELRAGQIAGYSCTNGDCPIANYLRTQTGNWWSVGPSVKSNSTGQRLEKPDWVKSLIEKVDEGTHGVQGIVTREQFLLVLEAVRPS